MFNVNTPAEFVDFAVEKITEAVYSPPKFSHAVSILFFYFCSSCLILMYRHFRLKSARALLPLTTIPLCLPLRPPLQRCVECFYVANVHYFVFVMLNIFDVVYSCFTKLPMVMAPPWVRLCLPVTSRSLM